MAKYRRERIQSSVMLDPDVKTKLRMTAAKQDRTISDVINETVRKVWLIPKDSERPPAA